MTEIIAVRFKTGGKHYYFAPNGHQVAPEQGVILETARGKEYGTCVQGNTMVEDNTVKPPLRPVVRIATAADHAVRQANLVKEAKALEICQEKVLAHKLDMKLVEAEYSFDGNKILFFFTSEGRVDFRNLVKDLAGIFHARIELRQIGVRDEAKMLGGLGICGRPFCCSQFLDDFQPVSIKMAKTQNLSLNPTKISGTCGRLMCCLKYEQDAYEDAVRRCPKQESFVETPDGVGNVSQVNLLREKVKVRLDDSNEPPKYYRTCELKVIRNGKGKRPDDYVPPSKEELESRRYIEPKEEAVSSLQQKSALSAALEQVFHHSDDPTAPLPTTAKEPQREGGSSRNRNRRRPSSQKPKTEGNKPKTEALKPQGEAKKPSSNSRNRRRKPKSKTEG